MMETYCGLVDPREQSSSSKLTGRSSLALLLIALTLGPPIAGMTAGMMFRTPLAHHMGAHILLMNALAPALAFALIRIGRIRAFVAPRILVAASVLQLAFLWTVHAPSVLEVATEDFLFSAIVETLLLASALLFWLSILAQSRKDRWRALVSLLLTGKLFCLLGVLLVFSPRSLYSTIWSHHEASLADQQLAGLLMVVACPLTYLLAATIIAARWLHELDITPVTEVAR